jgi:hypothetical protein
MPTLWASLTLAAMADLAERTVRETELTGEVDGRIAAEEVHFQESPRHAACWIG